MKTGKSSAGNPFCSSHASTSNPASRNSWRMCRSLRVTDLRKKRGQHVAAKPSGNRNHVSSDGGSKLHPKGVGSLVERQNLARVRVCECVSVCLWLCALSLLSTYLSLALPHAHTSLPSLSTSLDPRSHTHTLTLSFNLFQPLSAPTEGLTCLGDRALDQSRHGVHFL